MLGDKNIFRQGGRSMTYTHIILERQTAVATITLNRPDAMNAPTPEMLAEIDGALCDIADDAAINVVVMTASGRAYCAGVGLSDGNADDGLNNAAQCVLERIESMPQATIAKVNGICFTGPWN
jgi:enoyl-CoA hydratase/carnithine racemase